MALTCSVMGFTFDSSTYPAFSPCLIARGLPGSHRRLKGLGSNWTCWTCTPQPRPSLERAVGSPGENMTWRARYGVPSGYTAFLLAMFAEIAVRRVLCAIMPLVEMSSAPYMRG